MWIVQGTSGVPRYKDRVGGTLGSPRTLHLTAIQSNWSSESEKKMEYIIMRMWLKHATMRTLIKIYLQFSSPLTLSPVFNNAS